MGHVPMRNVLRLVELKGSGRVPMQSLEGLPGPCGLERSAN